MHRKLFLQLRSVDFTDYISKAKAVLQKKKGGAKEVSHVHTQAYMGRGEGPKRGHITAV